MSAHKTESAHGEMTPSRKHDQKGTESTRPGPVFTSPADIYESDTAIIVRTDLPGVAADGLTIDLADNVLTIEGRAPSNGTCEEQVLLNEYEPGSYRRVFRLSDIIDQGAIEARLRDGVLELTLPKAEAARPRKIDVLVN